MKKNLMKKLHMFYKKNGMVNKSIVVMYSGGPDSELLLESLVSVGCTKLKVVHILYESAEAAPEVTANFDFVVSRMAERDMCIWFHAVDISADWDHGKGPEGNCHAAKKAIINGYIDDPAVDYVMLGHNLDDHIETVLMQLMRGAGAGSKGIPDKIRGKIVRPLLELTKQEIEEYCDESELRYFVDPQNYNTECTRQFMRHKVIPLLKEHYGKGVYKRVANIGKKFE